MIRSKSRLAYQPTLATELAELEERVGSTATGAITSIQAVYVPADDFTDPAAVHTFSHLSASIVLSRQRASEGFYLAANSGELRRTQGYYCHARIRRTFTSLRGGQAN